MFAWTLLLLHEAMVIRQSRLSCAGAFGALGSSHDKRRGMNRPQQLLTIVALCGAASLAASDRASWSCGPVAVENAVTPGRDWDPPTGAIALNAGAGAIEIPLPAVVGSIDKVAPSESDIGSFKLP